VLALRGLRGYERAIEVDLAGYAGVHVNARERAVPVAVPAVSSLPAIAVAIATAARV
jgi:hypothetical protein